MNYAKAAKKNTKSVEVPKRSHFSLIGRGGDTIRGLQRDFNVKIEVPRREEKSNTVLITGDENNISDCLEEIEKILGYPVGSEALGELILDIPQKYYRSIFGSRGSVLKQLEKESACNIELPRRNSNSTSVIIEGPPGKLDDCQRAIEKVIGVKVTVKERESAKQEHKHNKMELAETPINEALFFPDLDYKDGFSFDRFIDYLSAAEKTLEICVFTITDNRVANVILDLHKQGVKVRIITDNDTSVANGSDILRFKNNRVPVRMDNTRYHMHMKFAVIDKTLLLNGSYNWTWSASVRNNENIVITNNKGLVKDFSRHFEELWKKFA